MKNYIFLLIIFITNIIQAITGFAGTLLAMPPSILLMGIDDAKFILNFVTLVSCIIIVWQNKKAVNLNVLKKIVVYMIIGMAIGGGILRVVKIDILMYIYGLIIIIIAFMNLKGKQIDLSHPVKAVCILICAGIIHGMFLSGGALLVVYLAFLISDKDEFRATIASVWIVMNLLFLIADVGKIGIDLQLFIFAGISCLPAYLGILLGNKFHNRVSKEFFMKLTYGLLFLAGILCFI